MERELQVPRRVRGQHSQDVSSVPTMGWEWLWHWLVIKPGVPLALISTRVATSSFREQPKMHLCWDAHGCLQSALSLLFLFLSWKADPCGLA